MPKSNRIFKNIVRKTPGRYVSIESDRPGTSQEEPDNAEMEQVPEVTLEEVEMVSTPASSGSASTSSSSERKLSSSIADYDNYKQKFDIESFGDDLDELVSCKVCGGQVVFEVLWRRPCLRRWLTLRYLTSYLFLTRFPMTFLNNSWCNRFLTLCRLIKNYKKKNRFFFKKIAFSP